MVVPWLSYTQSVKAASNQSLKCGHKVLATGWAEETGTFDFSGSFLVRPRGRGVDSGPGLPAVRLAQRAVPDGMARFMTR